MNHVRKEIILLVCCIFPILITSCYTTRALPPYNVTKINISSELPESEISYVALYHQWVFNSKRRGFSFMTGIPKYKYMMDGTRKMTALFRIDGTSIEGASALGRPVVALSPGLHKVHYMKEGKTTGNITWYPTSTTLEFETKAGTDYYLLYAVRDRGSGPGPFGSTVRYGDPELRIHEASTPFHRVYIKVLGSSHLDYREEYREGPFNELFSFNREKIKEYDPRLEKLKLKEEKKENIRQERLRKLKLKEEKIKNKAEKKKEKE